ncbi:polysaccharide deacetylase family protein [Flavobacterium sp. CYK-4]|uniref:polysaccharide deacetylase family protein n=1 Tax=Flavobacterium lotistagni TaxID=2709660 RepID=UPI00140C87A7|nr:polysaccharide deacetylase family protein [Flavobacterium lotistagni]NHM05868.1 polysaccharide deacetylase family protein [Flavobacterium lotistagni]
MKWYWIKTSWLIKKIFPKYTWGFPPMERIVYLTFDDGPTPEITPWVLDQLQQFDAKATFFCIGDNIKKHPDVFQQIIQNQHSVGNHTFNHLNGWKTQTDQYLKNVMACAKTIEAASQQPSTINSQPLFRPPYGKIKKSQAKELLSSGYQIIMWDVLSADFDGRVSPEKCLENVLRNIRPGSIVVFHDSVKAFKNLQYALPRTLAFLKEQKYQCEGIV